ncbi:MAG: hypothetical protein ACTHOM_04795 [Allomuricauda sp.]
MALFDKGERLFLIISTVLIFGVILYNTFQSSDLETKIIEKDSHLALNRICKTLDVETCKKLKEEYKKLLLIVNPGPINPRIRRNLGSSKSRIISIYGIRYEDISFNDLLNYLEMKDSLPAN